MYFEDSLCRDKRGVYSPNYSQLFGQPLLASVPRNSCSYDILYKRVLDQMVYVMICSYLWLDCYFCAAGEISLAAGKIFKKNFGIIFMP